MASGMIFNRMSLRARVAIVAAAFALAGLVGWADAASSAYIAFSIFYLIPIFLAAWFGNRVLGIGVAMTCGLVGFLADAWTLDSLGVNGAYAFANLGLRLILFSLVSTLFARHHDAIKREQELVEREREAAESLQELNEMKDRLMRSVAIDAREPLGDIYARVVTLGFDMHKLSLGESRVVLGEIAESSRRLSELVNTLLRENRAPNAPAEPGVGAMS